MAGNPEGEGCRSAPVTAKTSMVALSAMLAKIVPLKKAR